jgi:hypothetical protein
MAMLLWPGITRTISYLQDGYASLHLQAWMANEYVFVTYRAIYSSLLVLYHSFLYVLCLVGLVRFNQIVKLTRYRTSNVITSLKIFYTMLYVTLIVTIIWFQFPNASWTEWQTNQNNPIFYDIHAIFLFCVCILELGITVFTVGFVRNWSVVAYNQTAAKLDLNREQRISYFVLGAMILDFFLMCIFLGIHVLAVPFIPNQFARAIVLKLTYFAVSLHYIAAHVYYDPCNVMVIVETAVTGGPFRPRERSLASHLDKLWGFRRQSSFFNPPDPKPSLADVLL